MMMRRMMVLVLGLLVTPAAALARQEVLGGVVVDEASGSPIPGAFLSLGERGPRAISDSLGVFRLTGAVPGSHTLLVQRFGYLELEVPLTVGGTNAPLRLRMSPDPLALEGLTVVGSAVVSVSGLVVDAESGARIPWASLALSQDAVRPDARASSDPQGVFRMGEVTTGDYFLRVEALGYESQYARVQVTAPPQPIELRLEPDSVVQAGVAWFSRQLRNRRNYARGVTLAYDQERLHYTAAPSVTHFLEMETSLFLLPCQAGAGAIGDHCIVARGGRVVEPSVFIDEVPMMAGLEVLASYDPSEIYLVEVFDGGRVIRAYTYPFMGRMAKKPMSFLPGG